MKALTLIIIIIVATTLLVVVSDVVRDVTLLVGPRMELCYIFEAAARVATTWSISAEVSLVEAHRVSEGRYFIPEVLFSKENLEATMPTP